ncbi:MAG: sigma-54-dependent transcriptional regulator [Planctomycetota bacterium]
MTYIQAKILVVENDPDISESLARALRSESFDVITAADADAARSFMNTDMPDAVIADIWLPGASGGQLVRELKEKNPECQVIAITQYATIEKAVEALREGAYDFLVKPIAKSVLVPSVRRALESRRSVPRTAEKTVSEPAQVTELLPGIIGSSAKLKDIARFIRRAAETDAPVMFVGESGTGKETMARAMHELAAQKKGPFVVVACESSADDVGRIEKEIFGDDGVGGSGGRIGEAAGGILFFDEITAVGNAVQSRIMKLLSGSDRMPGRDVQFVFATKVKPADAVRRGLLRRDLFYRLAATILEIPPLRERAGDIPQLAYHYIGKHSAKIGKEISGVSPDTLAKLAALKWPGNVREFEHAVERAVILASSDVIEAADIPDPAIESVEDPGSIEIPIGMVLRDAEKRIIEEVLVYCGGNKREAAKLLGIGVRTVYRKIAPARKRSRRRSRRRNAQNRRAARTSVQG